MKTLDKKLILSALFGIIFLVSTSQAVYAFQLIDLKIKPDFFKPLWSTRCKATETAVDNKIDKFDKNKEKDYDKYVNLKARLSEKIIRWEEAGYDVDRLNEDLKTLGGKIKTFSSDYTVFIDNLRNIKGGVCDLSESDYKDIIKSTKSDLMEVRKEAMDIRSYYWGTVRPDILDLKNQKVTGSEE